MQTIVSRIREAAGGSGSIIFVSGGVPSSGVASGGGRDRVSWSQLHADATRVAAVLQSRGMTKGCHIAILGPTSRALVTAMQATWLAGGTVVMLPLPMRLGSIEEFAAQTRGRIRNAETDFLLVDGDLAPFIETMPGDPPMWSIQELLVAAQDPPEFVPCAIEPEDLAVLQFTSGSTSEPKGVMLEHRTVCANHDAISERVTLVPEDVLVSWLPLYHDMGLIGLLLLGMCHGNDLVLGSPQDFLADPGRWMEWISEYGGTATAGPNFSYVLAARALRRRSEPLDLSKLRIALNGAEPVDPATVRAFIEAGARHGFRPGAVFPAFGMAEVAIGGTFPEPMSGLRTDWVEARVLESERYAAPAQPGSETGRELVRLGTALGGMELRVADPDNGTTLGDREVGELLIRGTSVTPGYYGNPRATAELLRDGWLHTGDLAYLIEGDLVICGRIKDVIIVGGRNVFPQDVERAVGEVEGVRPGNVIAFGVEGRKGKESLIVVAETKEVASQQVRRCVLEKVREAIGLPAKEVVLVAAGTLPKTSSGKLQRALCKQRYLEAELVSVSK